ncbi:MAG TPA: lysophospholipid acyltransferase family protein [Gemmatimonadales bacterium]|nr:lysophospholipid acyltransferase family protein [Gemmatimonadales bacterium]
MDFSALPPLAIVPPSIPRRGGPIRRLLGRLALRLMGWRMVGSLPDLPKFVIIAAPHTTNWDFVRGISLVFALSLDAKWIGKRELFVGPFGPLFRWLGGIPIDRKSPQGAVEGAVAAFGARERMILAIAPEGTRKSVQRWKTGFYRIAAGAGVPIVCGFFDNRHRVLGFAKVVKPAGEMTAEIAALEAWYAPLQPTQPYTEQKPSSQGIDNHRH